MVENLPSKGDGEHERIVDGQNQGQGSNRREHRLERGVPIAFGLAALLLAALSSGFAVFSACFFDKQDLVGLDLASRWRLHWWKLPPLTWSFRLGGELKNALSGVPLIAT